MSFMNDIISWLKDIEDYFYDAYLEVWDWVYPFWLLGYPLLSISRGFGWLAYYFGEFRNWLLWAKDEIDDILSWGNIKSRIRDWLDGIEDLVEWFGEWADHLLSTVNSWWEAVQVTVKGWIAIAVEGLAPLLEAWSTFWSTIWPEWTGKLSELRSLWDNFVEETLPGLLDLTKLTEWWNARLVEIQQLINTALADWFPFYDELVAIWEDIKELFADPETWLLDKIERMLVRFW